MIQSGQIIEKINEKIAILKVEVAQCGALGLTNIHKHCENFTKKLLNIVYGYQLKNLNETTENYPGIDLGDESNGIAYQITAEKTSNKVDETLATVLKYKHYKKFPNIQIFMLLGKQGSYTIKTQTEPHFKFTTETGLVDFDDLLIYIKDLPLGKLKEIINFLEGELPKTDSQLPKIPGVIKVTESKEVPPTSLINIASGTAKTKLKIYEHFTCTIEFKNEHFTAPVIYQKMNKFFKSILGKQLFPTLYDAYKSNISPMSITYWEQPHTWGGVSNHCRESIVQITDNKIQFEFAQFYSDKLLLTTLVSEMGGLLSLLIFCNSLYSDDSLHLDVTINLSTNGDLIFHSNPLIFNIYQLISATDTFQFYAKEIKISHVIRSVKNTVLISLLEDILHQFMCKTPNMIFNSSPFLAISEKNQNAFLNNLKKGFED
jgi:hypothetical protein